MSEYGKMAGALHPNAGRAADIIISGYDIEAIYAARQKEIAAAMAREEAAELCIRAVARHDGAVVPQVANLSK